MKPSHGLFAITLQPSVGFMGNEEIIFTGKEEKQKELILSGDDNWAIT